MLKFYSKLSKNIKICYGISLLTLILIFILSIFMFYNATPQTAGEVNSILIVFSVVIIGTASIVSCKLMQNAVISSEKKIRASTKLIVHLKRIGYLFILMALVGAGISFLGGIVVSFLLDMFTDLRLSDFSLFCTIVKIPLFIFFLVFLFLISRYTGLSDAATKFFNPHIMLIALIFSFALILPGTVRGSMYDNEEYRGAVKNRAANQGKMYYDIQTTFSQNINLYRNGDELNNKFSVPLTIMGILAIMAVQIAVAMTAYSMGRKAYYIKHPRMSEEELDGYLPDLPD